MTTLRQQTQISTSATAESTKNRIALPWRWLILLAIPVAGILAFAIFQPLLVLPRMGLGPGFGLVDSNGQRVTNEDLRGQIVLYNITYTGCADTCPQTTPVMAEVYRSLETINLQNIPVSLVTISLDPAHDTPEVLSTFADQYRPSQTAATVNSTDQEAVPAAVPWHFVTGDALPLKYVVGGGFGIYYQDNEDGTFTFDPTFVLVDGAGLIRAKYRTATPNIATIQRDLELVAKEAVESTGATRLAYEAAHLFLCYPK